MVITRTSNVTILNSLVDNYSTLILRHYQKNKKSIDIQNIFMHLKGI